MKFLRRLGAVLLAALVAIGGFVAFKLAVRPGMSEVEAHRAPAMAAGAPGLRARWFGTTAVLLEDGEHAVMIDPFFSRPPGLLPVLLNRPIAPDEALIQRWLAQAGIRRLDAVLVSHSHYDHAMDAGVVARLTGATLWGSQSTANIGLGAGLPDAQIRTVTPGQPFEAGPFRINFLLSRHAGATGGRPTGDIEAPLAPPAQYLDYRQGGTYSILVDHPLGSVLHQGSAGFVRGGLKGQRAEVAFLGVALIDELEEYLHETVDAVGARRVFPTHWDDFTRPLDAPLRPFPVGVRLDRFFAGIATLRPGVQVQTLAVGAPVLLFPAP